MADSNCLLGPPPKTDKQFRPSHYNLNVFLWQYLLTFTKHFMRDTHTSSQSGSYLISQSSGSCANTAEQLQVMFTSTITMGEGVDYLCDFDYVMIVGARRTSLSISKAADLGLSDTNKQSLEFTENSTIKTNKSSETQFSGRRRLAEERDQRPDWLELSERPR